MENQIFAVPFWHVRGGESRTCDGMSLRDYFAAAALTGLCVNEKNYPGMDRPNKYQQVVENAYVYADLMLKEREK